MYNQGYFKGWYFKCYTGNETIAFIPAYHCSHQNKTASLQIITDDMVFHIPFDELKYCERPLGIKLGNCSFSEKGIVLHFQNDKLKLEGLLRFQALSPIRYDIMGPFSLIPFMQCRHSVYSMMHRINGQITVGGQQFQFDNGIGYIEGDRGNSFPREYIWTQCCFENGSLMLAVADIPFCGFHFMGIIGVVLLGRKEYRIATYLGARIKRIEENEIIVKQGKFEFVAKLLQKNALPLLAPANGSMCRTIHESASCKVYYRFSHKGKVVCEFVSSEASFEFEISTVPGGQFKR